MFAAHIALLVLIGLTPALLFLDSWLVTGLVALYAALCLGAVALSIRPGAAGHWVKTMRWAAALAALPLLWLVIQLLPLPIGGVSRSIWQSADAALNLGLWPHATVDPGRTLLALCRYSGLVAVGFAAGAVAIDRQEAERVFYVLGFATAAIALIGQLSGTGFLYIDDIPTLRAAVAEATACGAVISAGIIIMLIERYFTRRPKRYVISQFYVPLGLSVVALLVCGRGIWASPSETVLFAAGFGLGTVAILYFVRRIGFGGRAAMALAAAGIVAAVLTASTRAHPAAGDLPVRYAANASAEQVSVADQIASEVGMTGSGAGTFAAIHRLYATERHASATVDAPTFASKLAIELGRPALWVIVVLAGTLVAFLSRGGFGRGRDFFYSITGAGVLVAAMILAFCDIGQASLAVSIVLSAMTGLALVQSISRAV